MRKKAPAVTGLALAGVVMLYLLTPGLFRLPGLSSSAVTTTETTAVTKIGATAEATVETSVETSVEVTAPAAEAEAAKAKASNKAAAAEAEETPKLPDSQIKANDEEGIVPGGTINATVKRVVDGDTLVAVYKSKDYRVRLLCIDTPESVMTGVKVQPYGKEASEKLKELVQGKNVKLVFEKDTKDRYDRLLAYVLLEDGTCVNSLLVAEGYARVDFVKPNTVNRDYFTGLMEAAISQGSGLWSLPEDERPFVKDKDKDGNYYPRYYDEEKAA